MQGALVRQDIVLQGTGRVLQQEGEVTVVTTTERLLEAVVDGAPHIEIRAHLDLTILDLLDTYYLLGVIPATVKSMRVSNISKIFSFDCVAK